MDDDEDDSIKRNLDPMQNQLCRVCQEPAAGFHFGAFTCEGCKSFFGRTCNNKSVIQGCKNNYKCIIDKKNRTSCKACRFKKCRGVGMSKSGSRYGRRSNWFKIHCLMQRNLSSSTKEVKEEKPEASSTASALSTWMAYHRHHSLLHSLWLLAARKPESDFLTERKPLLETFPHSLQNNPMDLSLKDSAA